MNKIKIILIIIILTLSSLACNEDDNYDSPQFELPEWEGSPPVLEPHGEYQQW